MTASSRGRVYLMAFESRLANTCFMRPGSHSTNGSRPICQSICRSRVSVSRSPRTSSTSPFNPVICNCTGCRPTRSEEHTSELQSLAYLVCRLLLEKKKSTLHDEVHRMHRAPIQIRMH